MRISARNLASGDSASGRDPVPTGADFFAGDRKPWGTPASELAAGCFPSGKFGANAAWFRLNAMLYNLLSLLKRETLPGELHAAKPKRLRFVLLNTVGTVVRHAREMLLRVSTPIVRTLYDRARIAIQVKAPSLIGV